MTMIKTISKNISKDRLAVVVQCYPRKFATDEKKTLTTKDILDILKEEEDIIKVVKEPNYQVANYVSAKTRLIGEWMFDISSSSPAEKEPNQNLPPKNKKSIRSRMSKIAKK